jgi:hypothetical protein
MMAAKPPGPDPITHMSYLVSSMFRSDGNFPQGYLFWDTNSSSPPCCYFLPSRAAETRQDDLEPEPKRGSMSSSFRPKATIMFPNSWAANSFLLKMRQAAGWDWVASSDAAHIKAKPKGANDYILIGLNKKSGGDGGPVNIEFNAEKLGPGADPVWIQIYDWARRYRS